MNKKRWLVVCICGILCFFACQKLYNEYKIFANKRQISALLAQRGEDMRRFYVSGDHRSPDAYIAHGGGIGAFVYTNSLEAVRDSLDKGFRFIEVDLMETSDGHLLGGHDWKYFTSAINHADSSGRPLSLAEVHDRKIQGKHTVLTGDSLRGLMEANPFILVTDKIRNYELLLKEIPFPDRMIVEVFSPEDYRRALEAGIRYPAYCIWNKKGFDTALEYRFPLVTMDAGNFFESEETLAPVKKLHDDGVTILLFSGRLPGWESPDFVKAHVGKTVSKIYTNRWAPARLPESVGEK